MSNSLWHLVGVESPNANRKWITQWQLNMNQSSFCFNSTLVSVDPNVPWLTFRVLNKICGNIIWWTRLPCGAEWPPSSDWYPSCPCATPASRWCSKWPWTTPPPRSACRTAAEAALPSPYSTSPSPASPGPSLRCIRRVGCVPGRPSRSCHSTPAAEWQHTYAFLFERILQSLLLLTNASRGLILFELIELVFCPIVIAEASRRLARGVAREIEIAGRSGFLVTVWHTRLVCRCGLCFVAAELGLRGVVLGDLRCLVILVGKKLVHSQDSGPILIII